MTFQQKIFSQRLKELRIDRGLTAAALAEKVGLKRTAVANMESNVSKPSIDVFCGLRPALETSLDYLAGFEAISPPPKWIAELLPDLEALDKPGRKAVKALVKGLSRDCQGVEK